MKSKKTILLIIILLFFSIISFYTYRFISSPKYSIYKIQQSIKEKNKELFLQYVDLDSIINSFIDQIIEEEKKQLTANPSLENLKIQLKLRLIEKFRITIKEYLSNLVLSYFDLNLNIPILGEEVKSIFLLPLRLSFEVFKPDIQFSIGDTVYLNSDSAIVYVIFTPRGAPPINLQLKFKRLDSYWKLVEIQNLYEMFIKLKELDYN